MITLNRIIGNKIYHFDILDSTNIKAKEMANSEAEGTVIIAEQQTMGKGRVGRSWTSAKGKGIYMSIILKPKINPIKIPRITLIGAAAVNIALKEMDIQSLIKWPNDIVINGKKVCGILTEMNPHINDNHVIIGIGINANLNPEDIPDKLKEKATSLKIVAGRDIDRKRLIDFILKNFEALYYEFINEDNLNNTIEICKSNSAIIGKEIKVISGDIIRHGKAIDINKEGELVVEFETGVETIFSGEISIRGIDGYI